MTTARGAQSKWVAGIWIIFSILQLDIVIAHVLEQHAVGRINPWNYARLVLSLVVLVLYTFQLWRQVRKP